MAQNGKMAGEDGQRVVFGPGECLEFRWATCHCKQWTDWGTLFELSTSLRIFGTFNSCAESVNIAAVCCLSAGVFMRGSFEWKAEKLCEVIHSKLVTLHWRSSGQTLPRSTNHLHCCTENSDNWSHLLFGSQLQGRRHLQQLISSASTARWLLVLPRCYQRTSDCNMKLLLAVSYYEFYIVHFFPCFHFIYLCMLPSGLSDVLVLFCPVYEHTLQTLN